MRPGSSIARAAIAQALDRLLAEESQRATAERLGCAQSTVGRRGADLAAWPAQDLLALAVGDQDLADAIVGYLRGSDAPTGSAVRVVAGSHHLLSTTGTLIATLAADLADGRITADEAHDIRDQLRALVREIQQLDADLATIEGA